MSASVTAFGLEVAARKPIPVSEVDLTRLVFDPKRQIMLAPGEDGVNTPWCKHSDGQTTTNSNADGHGGPETDTDWTED
ncbi:hypothetical protein GCM10011581_46170 [Saccharopolyspora subtropica]|uniref:Uncharacterized protein n=1 Tax=Saccharopolyspora thermophila TaxID=89367 RepID=A0A917NIK8_9PSEU|nr:putative ATP-grasp-modified RiPP [Saccharopolyspora subtropica]GGJ03930.1 hypothetical protein GCM10011581_46170 [Saccharopolyspora subtropica]